LKLETVLEFVTILVAGLMNGSFAVPMKWTRKWAWENIWLAWSLIALILFPFLLTSFTIPHPAELYRQSDHVTLVLVCLSGVGWGAGQLLFGLGIKRVGMALGFAIVIGLAAVMGSLVPLAMVSGHATSPSSWQLIAGILVVLAGVGLCSYAGSLKDPDRSTSASDPRIGILFCVLAGVGGALINVGMVIGMPLARLASSENVPISQQTNLIWLPLLAAGFLTTAIYCSWLLTKNRTWRLFTAPGSLSHWLLAVVMAICWFGSVELYGMAVGGLGSLGPALGWPIFLSSSIAGANTWGFATGEWRHVKGRPLRLMLAGIGLLLIAMFVIGLSYTSAPS
jgi:L-rhamnose-H+ transport protein